MSFAVAILVVGLTFQPSRSPKLGWTSERVGSKIAYQRQSPDQANRNSLNQTGGVAGNDQIGSPQHDKQGDNTNTDMQIQRELAIFTGLLVLVGFLQAGIFYWQGTVFRRTLNAIQGQTSVLQESISVARTSASAATVSADALVAAERAWLDGDVVGNLNVRPNFSLNIRNHGRTPAQFLGCEISSDCLEEGTECRPERFSSKQTYNFGWLIASGANRDITNSLSPENIFHDWDAVASGKKTGMVYVVLKYRDVIVEERMHETHFGYIWRPEEKTFMRLSIYNKYA
jgi:hypothetical protein